MIVTCIYVRVKPDHVDDFIHAMTDNHKNSILEPGNLRFDVLQDQKEPSGFMIYEAYESPEAAAAHKETAHYLRWRDAVKDWMAQPREGNRYNIIAPTDLNRW